MKLSTRNQLQGTVKAVQLGNVMAQVTIDLGGGQAVTSVITKSAALDLDLKAGDRVTALIKASSVMIGK